MASNTDHFMKARRRFSTQLGVAGCTNTDTTIPLASVTGLDTDTAIVVVIDAVDANGVATPTKEEVVIGVVSGGNLINCLRGQEGTTAQAHLGGAAVTMYFTETHWDSLINGILTQHNQDGTHGRITQNVVALTDAATINTDASAGNIFKVTLGGNRTIAAPANPAPGQKLLYRFTQDATGSRTLTWNAVFKFTTDVPAPTLSTAAGKTDYVGFIYDADKTQWECVAVSRGY